MDGLVRRGRPWVPTEPAESCPPSQGRLGGTRHLGLKVCVLGKLGPQHRPVEGAASGPRGSAGTAQRGADSGWPGKGGLLGRYGSSKRFQLPLNFL